MTSSRTRLGNELDGRNVRFIAHTDELGLPTITIVSLDHLTAATVQLVNKTLTEDHNVRTRSTRAGAVNPDDLTCLNTDSTLVPDTGAIVLVTVPLGAPRLWLIDQKVSTIDSNEAGCTNIVDLPVLPFDLVEVESNSVRTMACHFEREQDTS